MLAILIAIFIGAWGLSPSGQPQPAQRIEKQTQPTQQNAAAEPPTNKKEQKTENGAGKKENDQSRLNRIVKFVREYNAEIVAISTAVIGLFTVVLSAATFALWFGGERHSNRELRAHISVRPGFVFNFAFPPAAIIVVRCVLTNHGKTPAFRINTAYDVGCFPSG